MENLEKENLKETEEKEVIEEKETTEPASHDWLMFLYVQ